MTQRTLTDLENRILDFAAVHDVTRLDSMGTAEPLRTEFGWRPVTFHQQLRRLLAEPAAERERAIEVRRLRRMLEAARAARTATVPRAG